MSAADEFVVRGTKPGWLFLKISFKTLTEILTFLPATPDPNKSANCNVVYPGSVRSLPKLFAQEESKIDIWFPDAERICLGPKGFRFIK